MSLDNLVNLARNLDLGPGNMLLWAGKKEIKIQELNSQIIIDEDVKAEEEVKEEQDRAKEFICKPKAQKEKDWIALGLAQADLVDTAKNLAFKAFAALEHPVTPFYGCETILFFSPFILNYYESTIKSTESPTTKKVLEFATRHLGTASLMISTLSCGAMIAAGQLFLPGVTLAYTAILILERNDLIPETLQKTIRTALLIIQIPIILFSGSPKRLITLYMQLPKT